jgi:signal recognition particle receptor subunit beta
MVQINFAQKTVNVKIVYYGPGMSGKTTNLEVVHQRAPEQNRGDLTSISTDGDRTLFFDYMPLDLGTVAGMRTCFQVYTVPGQVYYNSTRKLVLQGVDGVIFIADSSASMLDQNLESLRNLEENLNEYGKSLANLPHVIQFNKRDLPDAMPVEELQKHMNPHGAPTFEAVANSGQGVFPTLKSLAAAVLKSIMQETAGGKAAEAKQMPRPQAATPAAGQPAPPLPQHRPQPQPQPQPVAAAAHMAQPQQPAVSPYASAAPPATAPTGRPIDIVQRAPKPAPVPAAKTAKRPTRRVSGPAPRTRPQASHTAVAAPKKKGGAVFTSVFVVLAAGAGALLAWFVLSAI